MPVKVAREFKAVRPGEVYPVTIPVGEIVDGRLEEIAREMGFFEHASAAPVSAATPSPSTTSPPEDLTGSPPHEPKILRAKLKEAYDGPDKDGKPVKIRKGAYVRNADAEYFVSIGAADAVEVA
jgi:hypothetical protein